MGNQEQQTDIAKDNLINGNVPQNGVPQVPTLVWNYSMQFQITNLHTETITFIVHEMNPFTPDGNYNFNKLVCYSINYV